MLKKEKDIKEVQEELNTENPFVEEAEAPTLEQTGEIDSKFAKLEEEKKYRIE